MPRPISRNMTAASRGSSTGVRNRTRLAAPAMPKARASESLMSTIISAPDTQSSTWAWCMAAVGVRAACRWTAVTASPMSAAAASRAGPSSSRPHPAGIGT